MNKYINVLSLDVLTQWNSALRSLVSILRSCLGAPQMRDIGTHVVVVC